MAEVTLVGGRLAIVDEEDLLLVSRFRWYRLQNLHTAYACSRCSRRIMYMHRLIVGASPGEEVDHVNRDGLDNRRANLRIVDHSTNMQNQRLPSKNTSGFRGVSRFSKGLRWRAAIGKRNKIYLGCFRTAEEAARAYDAAARKLYGDAAAVNFPEKE